MICWALLLAAPFVAVPVVVAVVRSGLYAGAEAWIGFAYVSVFSMFLGFFAWYRGLTAGGVAHVGQLQLAQPVLTLAWSAALLRENVGFTTVVAALFVLGSVGLANGPGYVGRRCGEVVEERNRGTLGVGGG